MIRVSNDHRPRTYFDAIRVTREILATSEFILNPGPLGLENRLQGEAEQLVAAAYRSAKGQSISRMDLYARAREVFPENAGEALLSMAALRAAGRPLQHVTGIQQFLDHEYVVGPDVLIPRPETEVLVTTAIRELSKCESPPVLGLEIGLGSGVVSIELLARFSGLRMVGSELVREARERASKNAERILGADHKPAERLTIVEVASPLSVWDPFESALRTDRADFVISNPPYLIRGNEAEPDVVNFEPEEALYAPAEDPLYFYRIIAARGREFLKPDGRVFVEIPHERAPQIRELFEGLPGGGWRINVFSDLVGRERVLVANIM
ncbi:MAG: hypothetical protein A2428_02035 [Bdellovibrionales bacterium RIFOXYC1_FULL_54_43]|nr:MAG: hypothetical protein A2428_02035 [Bdellovibrionales bacterium RIFOXYC1_FULL_54_43]OFZ83221.1 MAG: hypothetical protein A2603_13960 [Bdellovibrionales bacterium RIFOXYD1_FULL_55_31]